MYSFRANIRLGNFTKVPVCPEYPEEWLIQNITHDVPLGMTENLLRLIRLFKIFDLIIGEANVNGSYIIQKLNSLISDISRFFWLDYLLIPQGSSDSCFQRWERWRLNQIKILNNGCSREVFKLTLGEAPSQSNLGHCDSSLIGYFFDSEENNKSCIT